ncbi:MAG: hypothetical protein IJX46_09455 [Clostridia bacterium]|jgi:hypothetical protein|nr:hypothetical protein [Clostridia bacterium]
MCSRDLRKVIGACALSFGAGILLAFILPWVFVAFIEAAIILLAGLMLLR